MSGTKKYEMMILLQEEFNDSDLKVWAFNYAKVLQNLSASQISVISRGKRNLAYSINKQKKGNFIQINFLGMPYLMKNFSKDLKLDTNVLRFFILNKNSST